MSAGAMVLASAGLVGHSHAADPDKILVKSTQAAFRSVARRMRPYVVRIDTVGGSQPTGSSAGAESADGSADPSRNPFQDTPGSDFELADGPTTGLIWSSDGLIITSSFNFVRQPLLITVAFSDGSRMAADLVARDQVRKIALLKVDASNLPVPPWAPQEELAVGQWAVTLGRGYGGDAQAVGVGIVSALNRMSGFAIQTDAKLSTANYGGPLCDIQGRVIGLCAPMALRPGELAGIKMYDAGVGFVVPKHRLDEIVPELIKGRSFYRGWLGVSVDSRTTDAVLIRNVASPSPMEEAGVLPGDRITFAAGCEIKHYGHLTRALSMISAGEEIDVRLERDGGEFQVIVPLARSSELGPLPEPEPLDPVEPEIESELEELEEDEE